MCFLFSFGHKLSGKCAFCFFWDTHSPGNVLFVSKSLVGPLVFGAFQRAGRSRKHQETAAKKHETAGNKAALERRARACKGKLREHTFLLYTLRAARLGQHQPVSACFEGMAFRCGRSLQGRLQALSAPFVPLLVGCLGGRLWAEVLRAMFMSACGRLWALLRGACGRMGPQGRKSCKRA